MTKHIEIANDLLKGQSCCLIGGGGVGKTYTTNLTIDYIKENHKNTQILLCGSTGIASTHINGLTLSRALGIGVNNKVSEASKIMRTMLFKKARPYLETCKIIVIDEVSMVRSDQLDLIDAILKRVRRNDIPFGGISILLVGDFLQLPPVVTKSEFLLKPWAFQSRAWQTANIKTYKLTEVKRQSDIDFITALNNIRVGKIDSTTYKLIKAREIPVPDNIENIVNIFATNNEVNNYNNKMIKKIDGYEFYFEAIISTATPSDYYELKEKTNMLKELNLKEGCQVMILTNDESLIYTNGTIGKFLGVVQSVGETEMDRLFDSIKVEIDYKDEKREVIIPVSKTQEFTKVFNDENSAIRREYNEVVNLHGYNSNRAKEIRKEHTKYLMMQYPVKPCYAITSHKSQGLSLDNVFIDFKNFKSDGQAYVALSRVKTYEGLYVKNFHNKAVKTSKDALNFMQNGNIKEKSTMNSFSSGLM